MDIAKIKEENINMKKKKTCTSIFLAGTCYLPKLHRPNFTINQFFTEE